MNFLLIIGFIVADVMASIWFGKLVGGWMLLLWFVMAFFVGRNIMRSATKELMPQFQQAQQGQSLDPNTPFLGAICVALAGFLFILPSILTDVAAMLLLLPPVQKMLQSHIQKAFQQRGSYFMTMGGMGGLGTQGQSPFGGQPPFKQEQNPFSHGDVFEGEATEVAPASAARITLVKPQDKQ